MSVETFEAASPITINGVLISEHEIGLELQHHPAESKELAKNKAIEALLVKQALLHEAKKQGIDSDAVKAYNPNPDLNEGEVETDDEAIIRVLLDKSVPAPKATEAECKRYYEVNLERFRTTPLIQARHILLGAAPDDVKARRETAGLAKNLIEKLQKKPHLFSKLAKEFSACPSKAEGGDLGQITKGQTTSEFERQLFVMPQGLSAKPIETRYGYHVVQIDQKEEGKLLDFSMVQNKIELYLQERVKHKGISQYIHQLLVDADIQGIEIDLESSMLMQ